MVKRKRTAMKKPLPKATTKLAGVEPSKEKLAKVPAVQGPKPWVKTPQLDPEAVLSLEKGKWIHFGRRPFDCPRECSRGLKGINVEWGIRPTASSRPPERCRNCFRVILVEPWNGKNAKRLAEAINYYADLSRKGELKLPVGGELGRPEGKADELVAVLYFESEKQRDGFRLILEGGREGIEGLDGRGIKAEIKSGSACRRIRDTYLKFFEEAAKERRRMRREIGKKHLTVMADKFSGDRVEAGVPKEPAGMPAKPAIRKKAEFTRRPERREKKTWGRVPSPAPKAERPKELPGAGRGPVVYRTGLRTAWEGVLAGTGLALLISSFIVSYGLIGRAPEPSNVAGVAILISIGAIPTLFCRRGCSDIVRMGGGSAFAAAGLGLLLFSFLATHGLMWETLKLANVVWLGVMIAVGALLAAAGIQMIRELRCNARKAWGSAFAGAGLGTLVICVIVAYDLMGRALQWANVAWLGIMMAVGAFAAWEGFPLVLEPKDRIRLAWEGAFMAAGIGTLISCVIPARGLLDKTLETANVVAWLSILIVSGTFFLASAIERARER